LTSYRDAAAALEAAETQIAQGQFVQANEGLARAIDALGDQYSEHSPELFIDDTGLPLSGATFAERNGDFRQASQMRRRTLSSRLEIYRTYSCRA
jgi:hypothetical protein